MYYIPNISAYKVSDKTDFFLYITPLPKLSSVDAATHAMTYLTHTLLNHIPETPPQHIGKSPNRFPMADGGDI